MRRLNQELIQTWLVTHHLTVKRLAFECSELSVDTVSEGAMRQAIFGNAPMRPGRIRLICEVTRRHGDAIPYERLALPGPEQTRP
jgi:hypothetical protein